MGVTGAGYVESSLSRRPENDQTSASGAQELRLAPLNASRPMWTCAAMPRTACKGPVTGTCSRHLARIDPPGRPAFTGVSGAQLGASGVSSATRRMPRTLPARSGLSTSRRRYNHWDDGRLRFKLERRNGTSISAAIKTRSSTCWMVKAFRDSDSSVIGRRKADFIAQ
jgi:hypothetical protein